MVQETRVQSLVKSYQKLKKFHLMPPCLTLSRTRCESGERREMQEKNVLPSLTSQYRSQCKGTMISILIGFKVKEECKVELRFAFVVFLPYSVL